jgi:hypothetical protein
MTKQHRAQRKLIAQLISQARWLERQPCSWELVRFVRTPRGTHVDAERLTSADADLFGLLATLVLWRDHVHLPAGKVELRWLARSGWRVALRVRVG